MRRKAIEQLQLLILQQSQSYEKITNTFFSPSIQYDAGSKYTCCF